jgi:hypothetical protein
MTQAMPRSQVAAVAASIAFSLLNHEDGNESLHLGDDADDEDVAAVATEDSFDLDFFSFFLLGRIDGVSTSRESYR